MAVRGSTWHEIQTKKQRLTSLLTTHATLPCLSPELCGGQSKHKSYLVTCQVTVWGSPPDVKSIFLRTFWESWSSPECGGPWASGGWANDPNILVKNDRSYGQLMTRQTEQEARGRVKITSRSLNVFFSGTSNVSQKNKVITWEELPPKKN